MAEAGGRAPKSCWDRALGLLARRPHFRAELAAKLRDRGYDDDEVAATLERLAERRYLDDEATAASFVTQRLARGPIGRRKLLADLGRRGVDPEVARSAVEEAMPEDDVALAREAAERFARRSARRGEAARAAMARHLERKGFSGRAIVAVLPTGGD